MTQHRPPPDSSMMVPVRVSLSAPHAPEVNEQPPQSPPLDLGGQETTRNLLVEVDLAIEAEALADNIEVVCELKEITAYWAERPPDALPPPPKSMQPLRLPPDLIPEASFNSSFLVVGVRNTGLGKAAPSTTSVLFDLGDDSRTINLPTPAIPAGQHWFAAPIPMNPKERFTVVVDALCELPEVNRRNNRIRMR